MPIVMLLVMRLWMIGIQNPIVTGCTEVVQTTERYLGCKQRIRSAVNDRLGIEPSV
jgi:hypothetical protein